MAKQSEQKRFLVTRPSLADELQRAGFTGEICGHPFSAGFSAWTFPLTEDTKRIAQGFYAGRGLDLPKSLRGDR